MIQQPIAKIDATAFPVVRVESMIRPLTIPKRAYNILDLSQTTLNGFCMFYFIDEEEKINEKINEKNNY